MDREKQCYLMAKVSTELFQLNPEFLSHEQHIKVAEQVAQILTIHQAILSSKEAQQVSVSSHDIALVCDELQEKYESAASFLSSLHKQGLTEAGFRAVLAEELLCEQVLESISQEIPPLKREQALSYFQAHRLEFSQARTWEMSQILITVNDDFPENCRSQAYHRISEVKNQSSIVDFATLALQHSECPSALERGYLGWCEEGKLFPEISAELYKLQPNQLSAPIATEIGYHLVKYHAQREARVASFEEAWPYLQEKHATRAKQFLQKQWLSQQLA
jgi:peptidyl-prolyl cis-trans isomerase C